MRLIGPSILCLLLSACSSQLQEFSGEAMTLYSYQIYQGRQAISLEALTDDLSQADVILVGEWHTHAGVHRFQAELLAGLDQKAYPMVLAMEQFSRESQPVLERYLAGELGEQSLKKDAKAWSNYDSDYRPMIELAKERGIPVIAANAPQDIVRCVNLEGLDYLDRLEVGKRHQVAADIDTGQSTYKEKFVSAMGHGSSERIEKLFAAQVTRDATMAESIIHALERYPGHKVMLTAGKFHTQGGLAVGAEIKKRNPGLSVVVIDPVTTTSPDSESNDGFQLLVNPLPARYLEGEKIEMEHHFHAKEGAKNSCD